MTKKVSVQMQLDRVTRGAVAYKELDDDGNMVKNPTEGKFGGIYVRKTTIGDEPSPLVITVTVAW